MDQNSGRNTLNLSQMESTTLPLPTLLALACGISVLIGTIVGFMLGRAPNALARAQVNALADALRAEAAAERLACQEAAKAAMAEAQQLQSALQAREVGLNKREATLAERTQALREREGRISSLEADQIRKWAASTPGPLDKQVNAWENPGPPFVQPGVVAPPDRRPAPPERRRQGRRSYNQM